MSIFINFLLFAGPSFNMFISSGEKRTILIFPKISLIFFNFTPLIKISFFSPIIYSIFPSLSFLEYSISIFAFFSLNLINSFSLLVLKDLPKAQINIEVGKITISCTNQTGDAKEELFIETEGKDLEAGFNPKYFLDALKVIDDEEIFINFGTSISPCIIKPIENEDYTYMILPIRMKD